MQAEASTVNKEDELKAKDWEVRMLQEEVAASQGIRIRRRPPTGPPVHYVGPFEFRIQNEGNTPRNILEEIVWNKDVEVSQVSNNLFILLFFDLLFFLLVNIWIMVDAVFRWNRESHFLRWRNLLRMLLPQGILLELLGKQIIERGFLVWLLKSRRLHQVEAF